MNPLPTFQRTRIAPTPSGFLHLGNVLSFAITAALAKKAGARILLRIDDIDRERTDQRYVRDIFDTLQYLEISWDEGPISYEEFQQEYSQLHRMDLYLKALEVLKATGQVFACECSRTDITRAGTDGAYPGTCRSKKIPLDQPGVAWRLRTDPVSLHPSMKDFIIRRKDGFPAYQLTSLVDDRYFGVDGIIRGEDLWPSTQAQLFLSQLLPDPSAAGRSFSDNFFCHHLLLPDPAGGKLSKSAGATSVQFMRKEGKSPENIYTMIGEMLGSTGRVRNYQELADLVFAHTGGYNAPP
jgi:glutamyl/glutaminyl-tRNA synthetase